MISNVRDKHNILFSSCMRSDYSFLLENYERNNFTFKQIILTSSSIRLVNDLSRSLDFLISYFEFQICIAVIFLAGIADNKTVFFLLIVSSPESLLVLDIV